MIDFLQAITAALALSSHRSDLELHQAAVDTFLKNNRNKITLASSYSRYLISIEHSKRVEHIVEIQRFRYRSDSLAATHSLSSDILIPFGSYTIRFVLFILRLYYKQDQNIRDLCCSYGISPSTLYDWKRLFEAHTSSYLTILKLSGRACNDRISMIRSIPEFPHRFYVLFSLPFLRSRYRCFESLSPSLISGP